MGQERRKRRGGIAHLEKIVMVSCFLVASWQHWCSSSLLYM